MAQRGRCRRAGPLQQSHSVSCHLRVNCPATHDWARLSDLSIWQAGGGPILSLESDLSGPQKTFSFPLTDVYLFWRPIMNIEHDVLILRPSRVRKVACGAALFYSADGCRRGLVAACRRKKIRPQSFFAERRRPKLLGCLFADFSMEKLEFIFCAGCSPLTEGRISPSAI